MIESERKTLWMRRAAPRRNGAVRLLIRLAAASGKYDRMLPGCKPENAAAAHVYKKPGFLPTGRIVNEGEAGMVLELKEEGHDHR